MAHDKFFLVCENKCFVEGMSKEEIERRSSYLTNETVVVGNYNNINIKRHVIYGSRSTVTNSNAIYSLTLDYFDLSNVIDAYAIVKKYIGSPQNLTQVKFEKVPCEITNDIINQSLIISCKPSNMSEIVSAEFIFVFEEF